MQTTKAQAQGVLPSAAALSPAQRQIYTRLISSGIDPRTARELAIATAGDVERGGTYEQNFRNIRAANARKSADLAAPQGVRSACRRGLELASEDGGHAGKPWAEANVKKTGKSEHIADDLLRKGQKPMGAAFQHAQASGKKKDPKSVRRRANEFLRSQGHKPIGKADGQLCDELIEAALDAEQAPLQKASDGFAQRFVAKAPDILPAYWHDQLHAAARASAGGTASGAARRAAKDPNATLNAMWDRRDALQKELEALEKALVQGDAPVAKANAMQGQSHVDRPLNEKERRAPRKPKPQQRMAEKKRPGKIRAIGKRLGFAEQMGMIDAAFTEPAAQPDQRLLNAARLVAGMDWENRLGAYGLEDARARASRQLAQDLSYYDGKLQPDDDIRRIPGVDIDLGSGQARAPGYLGIDLYPYDFGTALADVGMGLPFDDAAARSIRLVNALEYMPDYERDATPLLTEIQRVLNYGGRLVYQGRGDLMQLADFSKLPGLALVAHADSQPLDDTQESLSSQLYSQTFERVRVRVPRVYGADPTWLGAQEDEPEDIAFAMAAMGAAAPAAFAMSGLFEKSEVLPEVGVSLQAPIAPAAGWQQIFHCVVYAPNELDTDGEYMEAEDIEAMAHDAYRDRIPIKIEHQGEPINAEIVESYVAPVSFTQQGPRGPQAIPKGAFVIGVKVRDEEEWQKVLDGTYNGVSVGGVALLEQR